MSDSEANEAEWVRILTELADKWTARAKAMEQECLNPPCAHSVGLHLAAYDLRRVVAA